MASIKDILTVALVDSSSLISAKSFKSNLTLLSLSTNCPSVDDSIRASGTLSL